jgi:phage shock protein C
MLKRSKNRVIGGVCSGIAYWIGVEPIIIRIIAAIGLLFYGFGFWLYILLWILIPSE